MIKKRKIKDFQKKELHNPYFPTKKSSPAKRALGWYVLIFIFFIAVAYILFSRTFYISAIEINGNTFNSDDDIAALVTSVIEKRRYFIFPQSNIFLLSKSKLRSELTTYYGFSEVEIDKQPPATVVVSVKEKESRLILIDMNDQYFIDEEGSAFQRVNETSGTEDVNGQTNIIRVESTFDDLPKLNSNNYLTVELGRSVLDPQTVKFLVDIHKDLKNDNRIKLSHYILVNPTKTDIAAVSHQGWEVRFKTTRSPHEQIQALNLVLAKVPEVKNLDYIDLRFGSKVFYK